MFDEKAGSEIIDGKEYVVLCVSNSYEKKFYLNPNFDNLPKKVKQELKAVCVIATTESGGILLMEYDPEGNLLIRTEADEGDILFDEISAGLYVSKIQHENRELLEELELYYKVFFLHQEIDP
ncbi:MAG: DUF6145 family protein [Lachnospira sp.]|nr:DUF6145 family protein [Lachnospira sp.]